MVPAASRAAMAAPEPPLDPPGIRLASHGFTVTPYDFGFDVVTLYASSWVASLPSNTVPAWCKPGDRGIPLGIRP